MIFRISLGITAAILLAACSEPSQVVSQTKVVKQVKTPQHKASKELPIPVSDPKALLGSQLFFDTNLSKERNQSCATCHAIATAFVDKRIEALEGAVSLGSDGHSMGGRNAPTAGYAAFSPAFHQMSNGEYRGGQFLDGRASGLVEQAQGPFVNPAEMALPNGDAVVQRVKESPQYLQSFNALYGEGVLDDPKAGYDAIADAIASFEKTELFMPFDSKYDRALRGEVTLTPQEELGKTLFFSQQFTNCNACHQLNSSPLNQQETFTNYEYRNIGVPANPALVAQNGGAIDRGLLDNPDINDPKQAGKFKVPSLRNVAVTGPYMHNGVFKDLRTVVLFYDKYNNPTRTINPETGKPWAEPEVADNIDFVELEKGPALPDQRVDAIVAFLQTLTDQRYESLLEGSSAAEN
ncbi:cytochrome-c peroxidase [Marinomonas posidonica]|uniref:Cytochrome-c peroxidase n=1 Tax=Marinomonas posidonica (strain CECT 7376 / NCIMB 14433 / IVIA-Po-181) TaxID=491952 RepID=F6CZD4_MARPP|nr:cytochrome c peroxidase [Marinomonas posidonica]AEF54671.1 Cytochrome-c peroxidase [Marinomonas posidonica IVIA-Po-181]